MFTQVQARRRTEPDRGMPALRHERPTRCALSATGGSAGGRPLTRVDGTVRTTAFALPTPHVMRPLWRQSDRRGPSYRAAQQSANAGAAERLCIGSRGILHAGDRALQSATTELRVQGGRLRASVLARLGNRSCFPRSVRSVPDPGWTPAESAEHPSRCRLLGRTDSNRHPSAHAVSFP